MLCKPFHNLMIKKVRSEFDIGNELAITELNDNFKSSVDKVFEFSDVCVGEYQKDSNGYDALINAIELKNSGNSRLVIQVIYGLGDEEDKQEKAFVKYCKCNSTNIDNYRFNSCSK